MAFQGLVATLTTGAVALAGTGDLHGNIRVIVRNRGTGTAYLGGSDVTTNGFPLTTADPHVDVMVMVGETLYGTSTGAAVAQVLRMNETT
jgi:LysM repeat protein